MTDDALLACIMRRILRHDEIYFHGGPADITIDGTIPISSAEHGALVRAANKIDARRKPLPPDPRCPDRITRDRRCVLDVGHTGRHRAPNGAEWDQR